MTYPHKLGLIIALFAFQFMGHAVFADWMKHRHDGEPVKLWKLASSENWITTLDAAHQHGWRPRQ